MSRTPETFRILLAICTLAVAQLAPAETADREKPINFTADDGVVNYEKRSGVLKGNVVITQGTMTIRANRIDFTQNPDNTLSAIAYGTPLAFRQKRDDYDGYYEGWAQKADYNGQTQQLELYDNAILKRGDDEIRSNFISYNAATEIFKAEGRPSSSPATAGDVGRGDRVRGIFQPKNDATPGKPGPAKGPEGKSAAPLALKPAGELAPTAK